MGLGKTLTMISLVASDAQLHESAMDVVDDITSAMTLIIVPPPCKSLVGGALGYLSITN
jgi:SNF2 family DNA or RNA helicase